MLSLKDLQFFQILVKGGLSKNVIKVNILNRIYAQDSPGRLKKNSRSDSIISYNSRFNTFKEEKKQNLFCHTSFQYMLLRLKICQKMCEKMTRC